MSASILIILTVENIGKGITKEEIDLWKHTIMKGHILCILGFCGFVKSHLCRVLEKCQIIPMRFTVRDLQLLHKYLILNKDDIQSQL